MKTRLVSRTPTSFATPKATAEKVGFERTGGCTVDPQSWRAAAFNLNKRELRKRPVRSQPARPRPSVANLRQPVAAQDVGLTFGVAPVHAEQSRFALFGRQRCAARGHNPAFDTCGYFATRQTDHVETRRAGSEAHVGDGIADFAEVVVVCHVHREVNGSPNRLTQGKHGHGCRHVAGVQIGICKEKS